MTEIRKARNLSEKGLSLTQAQTISNLCNQKIVEINRKLEQINNCSKKLDWDGQKLVFQNEYPMPANFVELVLDKGKYAACIAFLRENMKEKENLLRSKKSEVFVFDKKEPTYPTLEQFKPTELVGEEYGWEQLSEDEINSFIQAEAQASHIGNVIHTDSILDKLRKEITKIKPLEFHSVGKNHAECPVIVNTHHTSEQLYDVHESLAKEHREFEKKVNYVKAKVINLTTLKNAEISAENAIKSAEINNENKKLMEEYKTKLSDFNNEFVEKQHLFEQTRQNEVKKIASLKIKVDKMFQNTIDEFKDLIKE